MLDSFVAANFKQFSTYFIQRVCSFFIYLFSNSLPFHSIPFHHDFIRFYLRNFVYYSWSMRRSYNELCGDHTMNYARWVFVFFLLYFISFPCWERNIRIQIRIKYKFLFINSHRLTVKDAFGNTKSKRWKDRGREVRILEHASEWQTNRMKKCLCFCCTWMEMCVCVCVLMLLFLKSV